MAKKREPKPVVCCVECGKKLSAGERSTRDVEWCDECLRMQQWRSAIPYGRPA